MCVTTYRLNPAYGIERRISICAYTKPVNAGISKLYISLIEYSAIRVRCLLDVFEDTVELIKAVVLNHQLALTLGTRLYLDHCTELVGERIL